MLPIKCALCITAVTTLNCCCLPTLRLLQVTFHSEQASQAGGFRVEARLTSETARLCSANHVLERCSWLDNLSGPLNHPTACALVADKRGDETVETGTGLARNKQTGKQARGRVWRARGRRGAASSKACCAAAAAAAPSVRFSAQPTHTAPCPNFPAIAGGCCTAGAPP